MEMILEVVMGEVDMEGDKVADEVAEKGWRWMKCMKMKKSIPTWSHDFQIVVFDGISPMPQIWAKFSFFRAFLYSWFFRWSGVGWSGRWPIGRTRSRKSNLDLSRARTDGGVEGTPILLKPPRWASPSVLLICKAVDLLQSGLKNHQVAMVNWALMDKW